MAVTFTRVRNSTRSGVAFARGQYFGYISVSVPTVMHTSPLAVAQATASSQENLMSGQNAVIKLPDKDAYGKRVTTALGFVAAGYVLAILPLSIFFHPLYPNRNQVREGDPSWIDVTRRARRVKFWVRIRAVARLLSTAAALTAITGGVTWAGVAAFAVPGYFGWVRPLGKVKEWQPRRVRGVRISASPRSWAGPLLGLASLALFLIAIVIVAVPAVLWVNGLPDSPLYTTGYLSPRYGPSVGPFGPILSVLSFLASREGVELAFITATLLMVLAASVRRMGRRFTLPTAPADASESVLYLRNFSDDDLKMATSALGRTSVVERMAPLGRQPFEEVLVRHLAKLGRVIAVSPPGERLRPLGAHRIALPREGWEREVETLAKSARATVIAATPGAVKPGLRAELKLLAEHPEIGPLMLVLAPHPGSGIEARWNLFAGEARIHRRFAGLSAYRGSEQAGVLVMVLGPDGQWRTWGARLRSEWTYAVAITLAVAYVRTLREETDSRLDRTGNVWAARPPEPRAT